MNYQGRHRHIIWIYDELWEQIIARYPIDGVSRPPHGVINMLLATGFTLSQTDLPQAVAWGNNKAIHQRTVWIYDDLWGQIAASSGLRKYTGTYEISYTHLNLLLSTGLAVMVEGLPAYIESSKESKFVRRFPRKEVCDV